MSDGGRIVVGGEALFDLVLRETSELDAHPGGGPFNTARTVARLDRPVAYLGRLSSDRFGTRLRDMLVEDGVRLDCVVDTEDPTTLALAELDESGNARYRFYAAATSAPGLAVEDALGALPEAIDVLHVGTLGLVLEPMADAIEAVVRRVAGAALVVVDPNCRPTVIPDARAYRTRLHHVLGGTDVLQLSEEDAAYLSPGADGIEAARTLLEDGPSVALLTRGPGGAVVITEHEEIAVPAPHVEVADTIGAGDAFGGGFVAWWHERGFGRSELADLDRVVEATAFACRVAAETCARPGASPPHRAEL